jgi:hypothetical protein
MAKEERAYSSVKENYKLHLNWKNSIISFTYFMPLEAALQEVTPQWQFGYKSGRARSFQ